MQEVPSQRFRALYRAVAKMRQPGRQADLYSVLAIEPAAAALAVSRLQPEARSRPIAAQPSRMEWVPIDQMQGATVSRSLRLAKLRAERELAYERARIIEQIDQARQAQDQPEGVSRQRRQVESAMQQRLQQLRENAGYMERPRR